MQISPDLAFDTCGGTDNCKWLRRKSCRKPLPLFQTVIPRSFILAKIPVISSDAVSQRHLPPVLLWKYNSHFCFICCAISPPSWGLKHALILLTTARRVYYGQQQEACRNLWGVCTSAEKEPWSLFAVSFHYSRRNFLLERRSSSRQTLHKRQRDARTGSKAGLLQREQGRKRNQDLKGKRRGEIQGSSQELQELGWQDG